MMRRYGAGVLLLIQRRIVQSRNACFASSTGFSVTRLARLSSLLA
jgi:hypothetical protein